MHFPAGAVPKDGPSAGITIVTALVSLMTNKKVRSDVAMTGEVSLTGRVLPVGGIRDKVLAAFNQGIYTVILPKDNQKDVEEIPERLRNEMKFVFAEHLSEVLSCALDEEKPETKGKKSSSTKEVKVAA